MINNKGVEEKRMQALAWKPKGDHFEDLGLDGRIILI
jgi:hypothetical protein